MKKNYKTKSMRLLVTLSLIACLLVGCGNSKAETQPEVATDETPTVEEATEEVKEEPTAEPETKEDEAVTEETTSEDETVEEETTAEETDSADPGEVTYITDFTSMEDYMGQLESAKPAIVIYNESEEYIINMEENQHYQLKSADKILFNKGLDGYGFKVALGSKVSEWPKYVEYHPEYSNWEGEQEFSLRNIATKEKLTCYLTPPTE